MNHTSEPAAHRPCVLLVDDDRAVRRALRLLLRARGYDVRDYGMGSELLADAESTRGRCLITDYSMPAMDGFALLTALRARGWCAPAILISGRYEGNLERKALETGFSVVIEKPLTDGRLLEALARCLNPGEGSRDQAAGAHGGP